MTHRSPNAFMFFWGVRGVSFKANGCIANQKYVFALVIQAIKDLQKSWVEWVASALEHCSTQGSHSL